MSQVPQPPFLSRWVDLRKVFSDAMDLQAKTLLSMCTALNVRFIGKSHSGIDDARNIARCALVLIQEHGVVLSATSQVKGLFYFYTILGLFYLYARSLLLIY